MPDDLTHFAQADRWLKTAEEAFAQGDSYGHERAHAATAIADIHLRMAVYSQEYLAR